MARPPIVLVELLPVGDIPKLIIDVNRKARRLSRHTQKWGFVLGSMPVQEAYEYLQEAENLAAAVRRELERRMNENGGDE